MRTHELNIDKEYADAVLSGEKPFEVRRNDRGYQKGDLIKFKVTDGTYSKVYHKLDEKIFKITYLMHGFGLEDRWCVFGIKKVDDEN